MESQRVRQAGTAAGQHQDGQFTWVFLGTEVWGWDALLQSRAWAGLFAISDLSPSHPPTPQLQRVHQPGPEPALSPRLHPQFPPLPKATQMGPCCPHILTFL